MCMALKQLNLMVITTHTLLHKDQRSRYNNAGKDKFLGWVLAKKMMTLVSYVMEY